MRRLAQVGIVLVALWAFVTAASLLQYPVSMMLISEDLGSPGAVAALTFLPSLIVAGVGALLILARRNLASRWFDEAPYTISASALELLHLGIILIGLGLALQALLGIFSGITEAAWVYWRDRLTYGEGTLIDGFTLTNAAPQLIMGVIRLAVAALVLGFSRVASTRLWAGARPLEVPLDDAPSCQSCGEAYDPGDYRGGTTPACCIACGAPLDIPHA